MEDLRFPDGSFDVVLSSLAFHYVEDFGALVRNIGRWLAETVLQQRVQIGGEGAVVFYHPLPQKDGLPGDHRPQHHRRRLHLL